MQFQGKKSQAAFGSHTCCLRYFTLVYLWSGRTDVQSCDYKSLPKFLGCVDNHFSCPWCAAARARALLKSKYTVVATEGIVPSRCFTPLTFVNYGKLLTVPCGTNMPSNPTQQSDRHRKMKSTSNLLKKSLPQIKKITFIEDGLLFVNWPHQLLTLSRTIDR